MAEDEPKPGFTTPGETGLGHGATAMVDTEEDVKNEPKMQELQLAAAKAERKTLKLKAAPDSGYGRRAGSERRRRRLRTKLWGRQSARSGRKSVSVCPCPCVLYTTTPVSVRPECF